MWQHVAYLGDIEQYLNKRLSQHHHVYDQEASFII